MGLLSGAVAGLALDQAIPFNRVWSFPKEIVIPRNGFMCTAEIAQEILRLWKESCLSIEAFAGADWAFKEDVSVRTYRREWTGAIYAQAPYSIPAKTDASEGFLRLQQFLPNHICYIPS